jgi:large subunit ribosomal protein LP0
MQRIRRTMRGKAVLLMGKNTMMRKAIRMNLSSNSKWEALLPHITYNVGMIFTNTDLQQIKKIIDESRVPAPAKIGAVAPNDVIIPKGITTLEPTKTGFLQALNIASKINKGSIEILQDVHLIKENDKVGSSEATLLQMLDIRPFEYGLKITAVYDAGTICSVKVLDINDDMVLADFAKGVTRIAQLSLSLGIPTLAAFPHVVLNAYKRLLAISLATDYTFDQAKSLKDLLSNPEALKAAAAAAAAASGPAATSGGAAKPKEEAPAPEEKEESEEMGFDLFG